MVNEIGPYIVENRRMLSRVVADRIRITHIIEPGRRESGCCTCFHAPDSFPLLSCLPCFDYPSYIVSQVNASKYILVRENSLEWNNPQMQSSKGYCCGASCCALTVMDDVTVLYFDDIYFDDVRDETRYCNSCRTLVCGGYGELVRIESSFCCGLFKRGRFGVPCAPVFCPDMCCPCLVKSELWVEDAKSAVQIITMARDNARSRMDMHES